MSKKKKSAPVDETEIEKNPAFTGEGETDIDGAAAKEHNERDDTALEEAAGDSPADEPKPELNPGSGGEYRLVDGKRVPV